jgi:hypothetical protein
MPDGSIIHGEEGFAESDQPARKPAAHLRRENVLLWCIGATFGLAMLLLLLGMILAEMSIHRTSNADTDVQPASVAPTYSIVAAR